MRKQDARFNEYPAKNLLINGGFDVWQRGYLITSSTYSAFCADRWMARGAGGTTVQERGWSSLPSGEWIKTISLKFTGLTFSSFITQKIESVKTASAKKATFSGYVRSTVPIFVKPVLTQSFGTGGTPASSVIINGTGQMLSANVWTKIMHTFDIPSVVGKVTGTDNNDSLVCQLNLSATSADDPVPDSTVDVSQMQLELGSVATEFERLPLSLTEMLCYRYYRKVFFNKYEPLGLFRGGAGNEAVADRIYHAVTMRSPPTAIVSSAVTAKVIKLSDGSHFEATLGAKGGTGDVQLSLTGAGITNEIAYTAYTQYNGTYVRLDAEL